MQNCTRIRINRALNEVFESFISAEKLERFWFTPSVPRLEPGRVEMRYAAYNVSFDIFITEIVPGVRVVFNWGGEKDGVRVVNILFSQEPDGQSLVEITEDGFDPSNPNYISELVTNKEGWGYMLSCWKHYLEGYSS